MRTPGFISAVVTASELELDELLLLLPPQAATTNTMTAANINVTIERVAADLGTVIWPPPQRPLGQRPGSPFWRPTPRATR